MELLRLFPIALVVVENSKSEYRAYYLVSNVVAFFVYLCFKRSGIRTTITVNELTKAGKTLLELAKMLSVSNKGVRIDVALEKESILKEEASIYNSKFVAMVKKAQKSTKRTIVDPNDVWGSLGLK